MMAMAKKMMDETVRTLGFEHEETIKVAEAYGAYCHAVEAGYPLLEKKKAYGTLQRAYVWAITVYYMEMEEEE